MMRFIQAAAAGLLLGLLVTPAFTASPEDAIAHWKHPDNGSIIDVYKCGEGLCAKVLSVADPSRTDEHNPDPALRSRPIAGIVILADARPAGTNVWRGELYNTQDGKTYAGTVTLVSAEELKIEGCFLKIFCKSVIWTKVPADAAVTTQ
jgi:uncharacterized protein (DUF2147 family)